MHEELKELLKLLSGEVDDLKCKLEAIDKLLGAPYAKDFSDEVTTAMVDDVLKYTMMLNDIYKFASNRLHGEIREMAFNCLIETVRERTQNKDS
jgi:hypothetical protein